MRVPFVEAVILRLLEENRISRTDRVLAVCASTLERDVFLAHGFDNVLITNYSEAFDEKQLAPFRWQREDAQSLSQTDHAFDFAFVSDGLHHCGAPHRALLEMYRVSRNGIVVIESRDSASMRLAERFGLAETYEISAVVENGCLSGGVNNSAIPNFVYRWTEREFEKTISSYNPAQRHRFEYFYKMNVPEGKGGRKDAKFLLLKALTFLWGILLRKQSNGFAMCCWKPPEGTDLLPWLAIKDGTLSMAERTDIGGFVH